MMVLLHQRILSSSAIDSFRSVTILLTATTILSGRTIYAGCIDWDLVFTLAIASAASSEAFLLSTALTSHFLVAPVQRLNEKNENFIPSDHEEIQTYRLTEDNLRQIIRPSLKNKFSGEVSNIRELNSLLSRTGSESKLYSFSKFLVNTKQPDSLSFHSRRHDSPSDDETSSRRRSAETDTCDEIKSSKFCRCNEYTLNCDNLKLSNFTSDKPLPRELKIISARQNHLSEIPNITGASNLVEMTLAYNNIRDANMKNLENFELLKNLDLSSNEIEILDLNPIANLNLKIFDASSNRLVKFLSPTLLLTDLFLDKNDLTDVSFLENFPNLQRLNLSYNQITYIDGIILQNLNDLNILDLRNNQIVNADFLSFIPRSLMTLVLSNNKISRIPAQTFRNKFLVDLSVDNNSLSDISFVIYLNVARLNLNSNPLFQINGNYFEIRNLRFLDVSGTNLSSMNFINKITNLIELRIENNNITSLPEKFVENYSTPQRLFLRGNPLNDLTCSTSSKCLDKNICEKCKQCKTLGGVVIFLEDENLNCKIDCVTNYKELTTKCVQRSNSSSQILIPSLLMLFLIVFDVFL